MEDVSFPEGKNVFKISEAAELLGVRPHVLRYWETEFSEARPKKSYSGQRVYHREDIDRIREIRDLLYKSRYSIEGARQVLRIRRSGGGPEPKPESEPLVAKQVTKLVSDHTKNLAKIVVKLDKLKAKIAEFQLV